MTILALCWVYKEIVVYGVAIGFLFFAYEKYKIIQKVREEKENIALFERVMRDSRPFKKVNNEDSRKEVVSQFDKFKAG